MTRRSQAAVSLSLLLALTAIVGDPFWDAGRSIRVRGTRSAIAAPLPQAQVAIVHPLLRAILESEDPLADPPAPLRAERQPHPYGEPPRVGVWIRCSDGGRSLEEAGMLPPGHPSPFRHARWTREEMESALRDPRLLRLTPAVRCTPNLDSSLVETLTADTHDRSGIPPAYAGLTGARVVVGIVDSGIDLDHGDFRDASNQTRIALLWDQTASGGSPAPPDFGYGRQWTAAQINAGLAIESDTNGHGTHVAGTAAGDGSATGHGLPPYRYVGMAPDAVLIVVKTDFYTDTITDAINYIFLRADDLGMPAVVNLSLGNQFGPHDGTDPFDQAMDLLSGPGHLIVAAAGNEADDAIHAEALIAPADSATVTFVIPNYTPLPGSMNDEIDLDGWYTGGTPLSIRVITPTGAMIGPVAPGAVQETSTTDGRVEIDNATWDPENGDENVSIRIYDFTVAFPPRKGTWTIWADHAPPATAEKAPSELDLWAWYASMDGAAFVRGAQNSEVIASPATADSVIAVAAYVTKSRWPSVDGNTYSYVPEPTKGTIAEFSSIGPRRDGLLKPDIAAPGMGIASALSSAAAFPISFIVSDGAHAILQGTSMASPHVAGLGALMYQAWGPISASEMRQKIASTARQDAFTGSVPNEVWGFGRINSLAATAYPVPATLIESAAWQEGDRIHVRFLLAADAGSAPLPVCREEPGASGRTMIGWSSGGAERCLTDSTVTTGGVYRYWLRLDEGGQIRWIGPAEVAYRPARGIALEFLPNPFVNRASIRWSLPAAGRNARLTVHDLSGRTIRSFSLSGRDGTLVWDGSDAGGRRAAAGVYNLRLTDGEDHALTRKILRLR